MHEYLVIIGGVAAGAKAAAKARRENLDMKISIYSEGQNISYSACGLPYYIEDIVKNSARLLVRSPEKFKERDDVDVYVQHKVTKIKTEEKKVEILNLINNEKLEIEYTKLLITTGAYPFVPNLEGMNLNNIHTLRTITDGTNIKNLVQKGKKVVIVGAGYIGLELTEAFHNQGLDITLIEMTPQVLPVLDADMVSELTSYLVEEKKINIITADPVKRFIGDELGNVKQVETQSGKLFDADFAVLSLGVKPDIELAKNAGIEIGQTGAIKVNERMQTNIPDIYAAGDCVEKKHLVTGKPVWIPLGSTANKEGRVAAVNITGNKEIFRGILGSHVAKIFDYTVSGTSLNEKQAKALGIDYEFAIVSNRDRAGYMPQVGMLMIKIMADKVTRKIIGAQVTGTGDVDKRINVLATAISGGMTVDDLTDIDITYAPPFSPTIDPVLTAAQVLKNKLDKKAESISGEELEQYIKENPGCCVLDVRDIEDFQKGHYNLAKNYPFDKVDVEKLKEDLDDKVIVYCEGGLKSYITALRLNQSGIKAKFVDGGCACMNKGG